MLPHLVEARAVLSRRFGLGGFVSRQTRHSEPSASAAGSMMRSHLTCGGIDLRVRAASSAGGAPASGNGRREPAGVAEVIRGQDRPGVAVTRGP